MGVPATLLTGLDIFEPVIHIKQRGPLASGTFFKHLVQLGLGFHRVMFEGIDITVEMAKERELPPDKIDLHFIGIGKDIGRDTPRPKQGVQLNHGRNGSENIAKEDLKFSEITLETSSFLDLREKILTCQGAGFILVEEGGMQH